MKKIGIGIIGDTKIATYAATQITQQESKCENIHLIAVEENGNADEIIDADTVEALIICTEPVMKAYDYARKALELGKSVVTNNASMLAAHGEKLWRLAEDKNVHLRFEACSMGAVPIFESLMTHFKGHQIQRIYGSLSATCNYALMRMKDKGDNLVNALSDASELGYSERDPNLDLSGKDSLFRIALLHTAAFGNWLDVGSQKVEGLEGLENIDIQLCQKLAANIKLLAASNGEKITVSPTLFEEYSQLGNTTGTLSGLVVESEETGPVFFCGHTADKESIASALTSDCQKIASGHKPWRLPKPSKVEVNKQDLQRFYIRVTEEDSEKILSANHLHVIDEQNLQNKDGSFIAYIVETGMPKNELVNFLKHNHFKHDYYLMNFFKE